jgi:hypothetical protein
MLKSGAIISITGLIGAYLLMMVLNSAGFF